MRHEGHRGHHKHHEGRHNGRREEHVNGGKSEGAKTFRRKRAIMFLEHLETKQEVLKKQLNTPELQSANPIIAGELKATQAIIGEFVQLFELYEFEEYAKLRYKAEKGQKNEQDVE
ncbi:hypothetical protein J2Z40_003511 [Cytobacillus eiseniae]|uniref:Uncharacterized protein n=1 Tax=Cytobacillus eiseniae TaxID=762947 RepID=A0ABS4RJM3_9BACI|nr:hypothetical protein [Cytobacillus eiseniae]MBP2242929.1 hypothetical protein [Cytobacillus eiseniae]